MRFTSSVLAACAAIAIVLLAPQAQAGSLDRSAGVSTSGSDARAAAITNDQLSARRKSKKSKKRMMTTGSAGSKVGGPNNARPTGTQAPDAQMGGGGKSGAR